MFGISRCKSGSNPSRSQTLADRFRMIPSVAQHAIWTVARTPMFSLQSWYSVNKCQCFLRVVTVSTGQVDRKRDSLGITNQMTLAAPVWHGRSDLVRSEAPKNCSNRTAVHDDLHRSLFLSQRRLELLGSVRPHLPLLTRFSSTPEARSRDSGGRAPSTEKISPSTGVTPRTRRVCDPPARCYVLVSPDCGDDVDGFVQSNRLIRAQPSVASSLSQYQTPAIVLFRFGTLPRFIQPAAMAEILDLGCARRC